MSLNKNTKTTFNYIELQKNNIWVFFYKKNRFFSNLVPKGFYYRMNPTDLIVFLLVRMVGFAKDKVCVHLPDERLVIVDTQFRKERLSHLQIENKRINEFD